jgi:hypothetical protein
MSIPASAIVTVNPAVISPGGLGLNLNGTIITDDTRVPIGTAQQFSNAIDVADFFGAESTEAVLAATYFQGYDNSTIKPSVVYFAQYPTAAVAGYLRGGKVTTLTLAQLGALSGSLTVLLDGYTHTAASINLAGCTSYTNAASLINTGLFATEPTEATCSLGTISGTTLTVAGTLTGTFAAGQTITGASVTADSVILSQLTGTVGGAGTYLLSQSSTVGSGEVITASATTGVVTFDSVSGAFVITSGITGTPSTAAFATGTLAASIFLTQATGAVLSQGAGAAVPASFMNAYTQVTQNWAVFMTTFDPDGGSGNTVKEAFASWTTQQNDRYNYACWDTDASPTNTVPATTSLGYLLTQGNFSGTTLIHRTLALGDANNIAAFYCGTAACINFNQTNGRITFAFKGQAGITPDVTDATTAANLISNGYNFYAQYATATQEFNWFYPGSVTGEFLWADGYCNQIGMNTSFQTDLMNLLGVIGAVPYDAAGYALIGAALQGTIDQFLNFGAFSPGVPLSPLQAAAVNNAAGVNITNALFTQGYYLQIKPATAQVRAARQSPPCTFWYTDAGAVQKINLASVAVL